MKKKKLEAVIQKQWELCSELLFKKVVIKCLIKINKERAAKGYKGQRPSE